MIEELVLDKVKLYRMRNGYTQTDMADLLGYKSKSGYNNIETGKVKMSLQQMAEIIKILGIPLAEINEVFAELYKQDGYFVEGRPCRSLRR